MYNSALFTPLKLGSITIPNRIGMSALTRNRATATVPNEIMRKYYEQRAFGGAGLIVSEGSDYASRPTEIDDPTVIIAQFKQAAINAKVAGFEGVELHGANGYLVTQFLDSTANKRTDKWGGSPENRARFALETLKALIEVYGPDVGLKVSPAGGYNDAGMPLQETIDTYGYLLREVNKLGLSYIALVRYIEWMDPKFDGEKRGTPHDVVATFAPFLAGTPIFVNSGVTLTDAEELVSSGMAAGIFIGVNWITNPDLGKRVQAGKALNTALDFTTVHGAPGVDPALGYTDYKEAVY